MVPRRTRRRARGVRELTIEDKAIPITLTIGVLDSTAASPTSLRMAIGTPVTRVAAALHAIQAQPSEVTAIFESLRSIGAIAAEIVIR